MAQCSGYNGYREITISSNVERGCCLQPVCPAIGGGSKVTFTPLVPRLSVREDFLALTSPVKLARAALIKLSVPDRSKPRVVYYPVTQVIKDAFLSDVNRLNFILDINRHSFSTDHARGVFCASRHCHCRHNVDTCRTVRAERRRSGSVIPRPGTNNEIVVGGGSVGVGREGRKQVDKRWSRKDNKNVFGCVCRAGSLSVEKALRGGESRAPRSVTKQPPQAPVPAPSSILTTYSRLENGKYFSYQTNCFVMTVSLREWELDSLWSRVGNAEKTRPGRGEGRVGDSIDNALRKSNPSDGSVVQILRKSSEAAAIATHRPLCRPACGKLNNISRRGYDFTAGLR
ncbi:hypothetical protein J6590_009128 [Homalodisca vitripennis]|nr:hypothetical protein J6590_009128 [Homalodisca vitripennis]